MKNKIIQECFGDYNYTLKQIKELAKSENLRIKKFIFEKILINSHDMVRDFRDLFSQKDL